MKAKDLIKILQNCDPETNVWVSQDESVAYPVSKESGVKQYPSLVDEVFVIFADTQAQ